MVGVNMNHFDAQTHVHKYRITLKIVYTVVLQFLNQVKMDGLHGLITKIILPPK